jgi:IS30 family transposase
MKRSDFRQLSVSDRIRIEVYLKTGKTQYEIAKLLGVHRSTISREVKERGGILRGYTADYAQKDYECEKSKGGVKRKIEYHPIGTYIIDRIKAGWSPEAISGRLRREIKEGKRTPDEYVCHESIYQFVFDSKYGKQEYLNQYLRYGKRRRTKHKGRRSKRSIIPNRIWIDDRPKEIDARTTIGHWEGDTIMYGRQKGVNSLIERKTRYLILTKLNSKTPEETERVVVFRLQNQKCQTITFDNGIENKNHENMTKQLDTKIYFCHPYHSWEKGSNEHANGIVRRYLPKKTDISLVTQQSVDDIAWEINNRPRKILGFATPQEMLELEYSKLSLPVTVALDVRI